MKRILTAIGNCRLNDKLISINKYDVIGRDIQYKEGILEVLKENSNVDILIISNILDGEISFEKLILEILKINNNIEIIVFIDNEDEKVKKFLYEKGIYKIYENNQISIEDFEQILDCDSPKPEEVLTEEIKKLKRIIEEQNLDINNYTKSGKITSVVGSYGSREKCFVMYILQKIL